MRKVAITLLAVSSMVVAAVASPPLADLTWSGFIQGQFTSFQGEGDDYYGSSDYNTFSTERARLALHAQVTDQISGIFSVDFGQMYPSDSLLRDAIVRVNFTDQVRFDMGQFKIPFSSEVMQSSADELFPMRALVNRRTLGEDPRDVGALLSFNFEKMVENPWVGEFAVFNGSGPNMIDNNTCKDYLIAISKQFSEWWLRGSWMSGDGDDGDGGSNTRDRFSIDARYFGAQGKFGVAAQYAAGKGDFGGYEYDKVSRGGPYGNSLYVSDTDVEGYWVSAWVKVAEKWMVAYRYQFYRPDTDDSDLDLEGHDFSVIFDWDPNVRFMANYQNNDDRDIPGRSDVFTVRSQFRF